MAKICVKCNKENRDIAKFCNGCGYKFYPDKPQSESKKLRSSSLKNGKDPISADSIKQEDFLLMLASEDMEPLTKFIEKNIMKNLIFDNAATALHMAARVGNDKSTEMILKSGVDLNARDSYGSTPLLTSIEYGNFSTAALIISFKPDISTADNTGISPLDAALRARDIKTAQILLEKGASATSRDAIGWTPLHRAAFHGDKPAMELLIKYKASPEAQDKNGHKPLFYAEKEGHKDAENYLKSLSK